MRKLALVFGLTFLVAACDRPVENATDDAAPASSAADTLNTLTQAEADEGWQLLFAGDEFDHWQGYHSDSISAKWVVDDNAIHFDPDRGGEGGDIITVHEYDDFELAFEWKISQCGNSGVIYRADDAEQYDSPWMTGPEYQILDNTCHPDAQNGDDRVAGANYDMNPPTQDVTKPAGEWNSARIVVDSAHVEHWLNGTKVVEYELWSDQWKQDVANSKWSEYPDYGMPRSGHIALQDHGDPVWFRNIRIREL